MFTGDQSGVWLYRALHRAGFSNGEHSSDVQDGLQLHHCAITAVCHCAPPDNKPQPTEMSNCSSFLERTIDLTQPRVFLSLGQIAWQAMLALALRRNWLDRRHKFGHGAVIELSAGRRLIGCYHPSQQNTFTGRLTEDMLDQVLAVARKWVETATAASEMSARTQ